MKKKITNQLQVIDPKAIVAEMEKNQPEWLKNMNNKEDMGNSVLQTSQELLIAIDDVLIRYFLFKEEDIIRFHNHLKDILTGVKEFENHGLTIMTPHSMNIVGEKIEEVGIGGLLMEIAQTRLLKEKMGKAGLEYPISLQATPFIKKLKTKNNG